MLKSRYSQFYTEKVDAGRQCARSGLYLVVVILSMVVFCALVLSLVPAVFVVAAGPDEDEDGKHLSVQSVLSRIFYS